MISIIKAKESDAQLLADIGRITFIESHGNSATAEDINSYINEKYTKDILKQELNDPKNIYHIIYHDTQAAGYSKIIYNSSYPNIPVKKVTKLERIYLLKEFYGLKLGAELFMFNVELSKKNAQAGMWLCVWIGNHRAVDFYTKAGFKIIGSYNFRISDTHTNPNHRMLLLY